MPKFALANNLWLGDIPTELSVLTLPEQLLIARHFPRCYVVKLYPRGGRVCDPSQVQRGLSGNVTLYNMNTNAIVEMLDGQRLPHPSIQLVSVLGITFVGTMKLPKNWLKSTFCVWWDVVREALLWLK